VGALAEKDPEATKGRMENPDKRDHKVLKVDQDHKVFFILSLS
jgi:hypothetical protein